MLDTLAKILTFGGLSAIIYCNNLMILSSRVIGNSPIEDAFKFHIPIKTVVAVLSGCFSPRF
jgi:hypothetical protein